MQALLYGGTLAPASSYYPSPVFWAPPAALMAGANLLSRHCGLEGLKAARPGRTLAPGYLLSRGLQALIGTAALLLTFAIGRALFSTGAGLAAALILAFLPWHIHASGYFKPDALLVTTVLLTFYASLAAVRKPGAVRYGLAGGALALAASSKLTGGLAALPLGLGTLSGRELWRRLGLLALAGGAGLAIFAALNPYGRYYLTWLAGLQNDYAMRAEWSGMTRAQILVRLGDWLLDAQVHGLLLGTAALLTGPLLLALALRRGTEPGRRAELIMFLALPPLWALAYAFATGYFKPNNFLPLLPFSSLAAGWLLSAGWSRAAAAWTPLGRPLGSALGALLLLAWTLPAGFNYVYRSLTPTTLDAALLHLRRDLQPPAGRLLVAEEQSRPEPRWEGLPRYSRPEIGVLEVPRLAALSPSALDLSDGEVFAEARLEGGEADVYRARLEGRRRRQVKRFRARPFRLRGAPLVAVRHRWASLGDRFGEPLLLEPEGDRCYAAELPPAGPETQAYSAGAWVPTSALAGRAAPAARAGAESPISLVWLRKQGRGHLFVSERFEPGVGSLTICLGAPLPQPPSRIPVRLYRWRKGGRAVTPGAGSPGSR